MDVILLIPSSISKVFDGVGLDLEAHIIEFGMIVKKFTPVAIIHCLS